jgi:hypothetical protein
MTKISTVHTILFSTIAMAFLSAFILMPNITEAAEATSRLGGGNALLRGTTGIEHANSISDLFARLTFAGEHGGRSGKSSPTQNHEKNTEADDNEEVTNDTETEGNQTENDSGIRSGNGGDGGAGDRGGLVKAGSVVSNSTALNMINVNIVKIGRWDD